MINPLDEPLRLPRRRSSRARRDDTPTRVRPDILAEKELGSSVAGTGFLSIIPGVAVFLLTSGFVRLAAGDGPPEGGLFLNPMYIGATVLAYSLMIAGVVWSIVTGRGTHTKKSIVKCSDGSVRLRQRPKLFFKQLGDKLKKPYQGIAVGYEEPNFTVSLKGYRGNDLLLLVTSKEKQYAKYLDELQRFTGLKVMR